MKRAPKKYKCDRCGSVSNKFKEINLPGIGFAVCHSCGGRIQETKEWKAWLAEARRQV